MKVHIKNKGGCIVFLFCLFYLGCCKKPEGLENHRRCIHIVSINSPCDDPEKSIDNYAFQANAKRVSLGRKPGLFRLKKGGFLGIEGAVAIESINKQGFYLRHKNYKFHLEKASNSSTFAKDATFYLLKVQKDPLLYAFELYGHPSWFIMHNKKKKHKLILGHVKGSEEEVMDSTFFFKKVGCIKTGKGQSNVQKKTVVVGHGTLMEDQSDDDDLSDIESIEEYADNNENINIASAAQTSIKEDKSVADQKMASTTQTKNRKGTRQNTEAGNVPSKERDIIHEVEQAYNATHSKNNGKLLGVLEKDIEKKVNELASSFYKQKASSQSNKTNKESPGNTNVEDKIGATVNFMEGNDFVNNNMYSEKQNLDDVVIKTEDSVPKHQWLQGNAGGIKSEAYRVQEETNKPALTKEDQKYKSSTEIKDYNKASSNVVKGSPKLVNENYEIIARASLGIPEGKKVEHNSKISEKNSETPYKHNLINKKTDAYKRFQKKVEKVKTVLGDLWRSAHISREDDAINDKATIADYQNRSYSKGQLNDSKQLMVNNATQNLFKNEIQRKMKGMFNRNGTPIIYFSEKCVNLLPDVCEEWAQRRYCLTFSELMKRYCRKACNLCDQIVTTGFSACDKTCGGGVRLRMLKVNNRQVLQRRACNIHNCPINGGYSAFSNFSECSATCGKGLRYKHRTCTQPPPQFGGQDCSRLGSPVKTIPCHVVKCKVYRKKIEKKIEKKIGKESHFKNQAENHDDYEHMPEYRMENLSNGYTVEIDPPKKPNLGKLKPIEGNRFEYLDSHGKKKIVHLEGSHSKSLHNHQVYHNNKQVANLRCGPSKFLKFQKKEPNTPFSESPIGNYNPQFKMFEDGKVIYDKYGMPTGNTDEIIKSSDSPYKIVLHKNKHHQLEVSEECLESDSSVNPDIVDDKNFPKTPDFFEYNYEEPAQSYGTSNPLPQSTVGNEVNQAIGSIGKAIDDDTNELTLSSLMQKDNPAPTLSEELATENLEALKERRYEEKMAQKSTKQYSF